MRERVTEDRLYKQIRETLKDDFAPVKPLRAAWKRALWIFPLTLLFAAAVLFLFRIRPDNNHFHFTELYGLILLQVFACYLLLTVLLSDRIPGSLKHPLYLASFGISGIAIFLIASFLSYRISPVHPDTGQEGAMGMACISIIGAIGLLALLFGFLLARPGLPFRARSAGMLLGAGGGLAAEAVWRLHCPYTSWDHILIFHGGAVLILALLGWVLGHIQKLKASRN